ncbi:YiiX/YebB-like N1pC/P60 family cysteine hydrolase [Gilvimarinus xylanilyticus]|uniref:Permuted papain-like amidase YaeF/Yiix C92 family enzyme n=1 Tax=Gilvimarinus xylanilyticus TaxID=2944139 RepID=A0A9X2HYH9_9GAMM|nr:YiiX/YebB-like N1pC/P60 family cysteine hydrolase [Gilvimarinus xylanilyticus]MCP8900370.1 hypothetical protein [Gilvimarinus xylanilyticus]
MNAGDVFLVKGTEKHSKWLSALQKAIYPKASSSHVLISVGDGAFVHATTSSGVDFERYDHLLGEIEDGWRVIRNKRVDDLKSQELQLAAIFFVKQAYNYKFMFESNDQTSFCSELVAKVYAKCDIELFGKNTGKITPADFDRAADTDSEWEDVTEEYRALFAENDKIKHIFDIAYFTLVATTQKRSYMMNAYDGLIEAFGQMAEKGLVSKELHSKMVEMETDFRAKKNISFWNEKKYPPKNNES